MNLGVRGIKKKASRTWFTSDTHFGHAKVAELRGFTAEDGLAEGFRADHNEREPATLAHDWRIIRNWNATVAPDDIVWHLGDVGVGNPKYFLPILSLLNGRKRLITGNHDKPWAGHSGAHLHLREWMEYFEYVSPFAKIKIGNGRKALLSHFPYSGDHTDEDRFIQYRLWDEGEWLFHGHVHDVWKQKYRQINVGQDVWDMAPVSLETLGSIISDQEAYWMELGAKVHNDTEFNW